MAFTINVFAYQEKSETVWKGRCGRKNRKVIDKKKLIKVYSFIKCRQ